MPFLPRACFLLLAPVLLFVTVPVQAQARDDGNNGALLAAASPEHFQNEETPKGQAKRTRTSPASNGNRGDAVQQALDRLRRSHDGGRMRRSPGGCGGNPGDVYMPMVTLAVRFNWNFNTANPAQLSCAINVRLNLRGELLETGISRSSGDAQFDASALQAVRRTCDAGQFPPPPSSEYTKLELIFKSSEAVEH